MKNVKDKTMDIRVIGFFVSFFILVGGLFFGSILLNFSSDIFFMVVSIVMLAFLGTFCYIYLGVNFPDRQITVMIGAVFLTIFAIVASAGMFMCDDKKISPERVELLKKYVAQRISTDDEKAYLNSIFSQDDEPYIAQRVGGVICLKRINSSLCKLWLDAVVKDVRSNTAAINEKTYGDVEAKKKQREHEQEELKKFEQENLK
jgi:hypothetical protein